MRLHSTPTLISRSWLRLCTVVFIVWSQSFSVRAVCGACGGKQKTHRHSAVGSRKCDDAMRFLKPIRRSSPESGWGVTAK